MDQIHKEGSRVLFVDDEQSSLNAFENLFRRKFNIITTNSGQQGLEILETQPVQVVIADQRMPEMTGVKFLKKVRNKWPDIKCILFTAFDDKEVIKEAINDAGIYWYLNKPFEPEQFEQIITNASHAYHAANKLKKSEEKFRGVFESMTDVFTRSDNNGKCVLISPSVYKMIGYKPEEIIGKDLADFYADPKQRTEIEKELRSSKDVKYFEIDIVRKDGKTITVSTNAQLYYNIDGEPLGVEGNIRDITERKHLEKERETLLHEIGERLKELSTSEVRFRMTFEQAAVGIAHISTEGKFLRINKRYCDIVRYSHKEMLQKTFQDITYPDDLESDIAQVNQLIAGEKETYSMEKRYFSKEGDIVWVNLTVSLVRTGDGNPEYFIAVVEDISQRKLDEKKITSLAKILETSLNEIYILDAQTLNFIEVNEGARKNIGYSTEEMQEITPLDIGPEFSIESFSELVEPLRNGQKELIKIESVHKRKDGSLYPVEIHLQYSKLENRFVFVAFILDITEHKRAEEVQTLLNHNIGERLKELSCMYTISNSIRTRKTLDEIFQDTVNAIPAGWHYPDITRGKLRFNENEWVSEPFEETKWRQSSDIIINGEKLGSLEVYYVKEYPTLDEGPFMMEERHLIDSITRILCETIERQHASEELIENETKYRKLVDNSLVGVFNTTLDGKFIFANEASARMYDFNNVEQMLSEGSLARWTDAEQREQMLAELMENGSVTNFEAETITHTGRQIQIILSAQLEADSISGMVMDITDRKMAEKKIFEYQQHLKGLANELTLTEERTRKEIANDLHDDVGQLLASIRIQLAVLQNEENIAVVKSTLKEITNDLLQTIRSTRSVIFNLSPPQLHEIGLSAAISDWLKEEIEPKYKIKTSLSGDKKKFGMEESARLMLFRSIRELIMNIVKHAHAKHLDVKLIHNVNTLEVTVKDDGIGFDENIQMMELQSNHYGLFSIKERISGMGGTVEIDSKPGVGTKVKLEIPLG